MSDPRKAELIVRLNRVPYERALAGETFEVDIDPAHVGFIAPGLLLSLMLRLRDFDTQPIPDAIPKRFVKTAERLPNSHRFKLTLQQLPEVQA